MAVVDLERRELQLKLVYWGPALSGKTTNLRRLHARVVDSSRTDLTTLDGEGGRTLFFDLLGLTLKASDLHVRVSVYTVPGQPLHDAVRRRVLRGVDGVAFVADSRLAEVAANERAFGELRGCLRDAGVDPAHIPVVVQFNKRDLADVRSDEDLDGVAARGREPIIRASAKRGEGVLETFVTLAGATWEQVDARHGLATRFGVTRDDFLGELHRLFAAKTP